MRSPDGHRSTRAASRSSRTTAPARPRAGKGRATVVALAIVGALVGLLGVSAKAVSPGLGFSPASLVPASGAWLGAWVKAPSSGSLSAQEQAMLDREASIGRKFAIGHSWIPWGSGLGGLPAWHISQGRIPMISFGHGGTTREAADGRHDDYFRSIARSVASLHSPVLLRYYWEMDGNKHSASVGSGADFIAAWRHVHDLFTAEGVPAAWVWGAER